MDKKRQYILGDTTAYATGYCYAIVKLRGSGIVRYSAIKQFILIDIASINAGGKRGGDAKIFSHRNLLTAVEKPMQNGMICLHVCSAENMGLRHMLFTTAYLRGLDGSGNSVSLCVHP